MKTETVRTAVATLAVLAALAALVAGLVMAGSPERERSLRYDQERSSELQALSSMARTAYAEDGALPRTIDDLVGRHPEAKSFASDPRTGLPYEYRPVGHDAYELCANFDLPSESQSRPLPPMKPDAAYADYWTHQSGRTCWTERVER